MAAQGARTSVLFVDDEPDLLRGLRRSLHVLRDRFDMRFAAGGRAALVELSERRVDLVVTDMRMPGMSGVELLTEVRSAYPDTLRFILSGHADARSIPGAAPVTHAWLSKPCNREDLVSALDRARALQERISHPDLRAVLDRIPEIELEVPRALLEDDPTSALAQVLENREELFLRFLETASSASFSLPQILIDFTSTKEILGQRSAERLALATELMLALEPGECPYFDPVRVRTSSMEVSKLTSRILDYSNVPMDGALLAGLLHRVGLAIQARWLPEYLEECLPLAEGDLARAQRERFGMDYASIGAAFLLERDLPVNVVEAVASHVRPLETSVQEFDLLGALHVATRLLPDPLFDPSEGRDPDPDFMTRYAIEDNLLQAWRSMVSEVQHLNSRSQAPARVDV